MLDLVPVGFRRGARVDDEDNDPANLIERRWLTQDTQSLDGLQYFEHGAHAEVVGQAAIHEMDVRPTDAVLERSQVLACPEGTDGRPRSSLGIAKCFDPFR